MLSIVEHATITVGPVQASGLSAVILSVAMASAILFTGKRALKLFAKSTSEN